MAQHAIQWLPCRYTNYTINNLLNVNAGWYYTWTLTPVGAYFEAPSCIEFVSMVYNGSDATPEKLAEVPGNVLLAYNEPDSLAHANMTVEEAIYYWPQLLATNKRLSSPACAKNILIPGSWMETFMNLADTKVYRVDYLAVHYYGQSATEWNDIPAAVERMRIYLDAAYKKYQKPMWVTEWCLMRWGWAHFYPSIEAQAEFAKLGAEMMDTLPYTLL